MSYEQDPNDQANISGADLAILIDELAASQAREKVLRELLPKVIPDNFIAFGKYYAEHRSKFISKSDSMGKFKEGYLAECEKALAQPTDDTALRAALAAERERCANLCYELQPLSDCPETKIYQKVYLAIRALENE